MGNDLDRKLHDILQKALVEEREDPTRALPRCLVAIKGDPQLSNHCINLFVRRELKNLSRRKKK